MRSRSEEAGAIANTPLKCPLKQVSTGRFQPHHSPKIMGNRMRLRSPRMRTRMWGKARSRVSSVSEIAARLKLQNSIRPLATKGGKLASTAPRGHLTEHHSCDSCPLLEHSSTLQSYPRQALSTQAQQPPCPQGLRQWHHIIQAKCDRSLALFSTNPEPSLEE